MSYQTNVGIDMEQGAVYGAGAYVIGLIITIIGVEAELINELGIYQIFGFEGYLFAQQIVHELRIINNGEFISEFLPMTIVMALLLVGAGYTVASQAGGRQSTGGPKAGGSITVGYFAMAVVATIFLILSSDPDTVDMIISLLVTGVLYPVVFGGLGGLIAQSQ